jgi:putative hydrolase of the HAD superfamily
MAMKLNLLFDLDDTLIHCNKYFDLVIDQFAEQLVEWFSSYKLTKDEVKRKQQEFDLAGIDLHGFSAERFPESFAETYDHYTHLLGRPGSHDERGRLLMLGYAVYDSEFELYPDVVETLTKLQRAGHELSLYTGGVDEIQRRKVEKVNLAPFFEGRIFVAQHKNKDALARILQERELDPAVTWMVGNSLRTDIMPALENGIGAVYIPPLSNWAFDMVKTEVKPTDRYLKLTSIKRVPNALKKFYEPT